MDGMCTQKKKKKGVQRSAVVWKLEPKLEGTSLKIRTVWNYRDGFLTKSIVSLREVLSSFLSTHIGQFTTSETLPSEQLSTLFWKA